MSATVSALVFSLGIALPPAKYDGPFRGDNLYERYGTLDEVRTACNNGNQLIACAFVSTDLKTCTIWLPHIGEVAYTGRSSQYVITKERAVVIRRHEIGHCNNWPAHHPAK